jgi:hypothetical protein
MVKERCFEYCNYQKIRGYKPIIQKLPKSFIIYKIRCRNIQGIPG